MSEDVEQQKSAEDEAKRQIRDQELARILAMSKAERKDLAARSKHYQDLMRADLSCKHSTLGENRILIIDCFNPSRHGIEESGRHGLERVRIEGEIIDEEHGGQFSLKIQQELKLDRRMLQGFITEVDGFKSQIIMITTETSCFKGKRDATDDKFLDAVRKTLEFLKNNYPNWILVDKDGNPLEEVLRQDSQK